MNNKNVSYHLEATPLALEKYLECFIIHDHTCASSTVEPPSKGHIGDSIRYNREVVLFSEAIYSEPQAVSFVERSIIPCPHLRGSTIGGSTVHDYTCTY